LTSTHFLVKQKNLCLPSASIEGKEHHHLSRVLRARPGHRIWLTDEEGSSYLAEVQEVGKEETRVLILERIQSDKRRIHLVLAPGLIKAKKMDFLVQKATELGMSSLVPVIAARSIVKIEEKEAKKVDRWQRIAAEAAKQSRRAFVPAIFAPEHFRDFCEKRSGSRKFLLCEADGRLLRDVLARGPGRADKEGVPAVLVLVGPEGGWTREEKTFALANGFEAVSLGEQVLRAETAALAALALLAHFWDT
jgi:16S rRNA (uracil1498-N3)-methyltransferase